LRFFKLNPNPDKSLPLARAERLWLALYQSGDFSRGWNHNRFKAVRDWLSSLGHILWHDNRYCLGKACRWEITDEFMALLDEYAAQVESGGQSKPSFSYTAKGPGQFLVPVFSCLFEQPPDTGFISPRVLGDLMHRVDNFYETLATAG
jgi:hypothetical protein